MKVSLAWLAEFVDLPEKDPSTLAALFTMLGHEVEGVEHLAAEWTDVYVGRVLAIEAHPDADRIRVCQVDTGDGPSQIICGAWNFEVGATVAVATPGAVLPGDFQIGAREIRGVTSNGMICSERELGLGDDHEGIMVLEDGLPLGTPFIEILELPDTVFDLSITPNRPDAMSLLGLARDLAAYYDLEYRIPQVRWQPMPGEPDLTVKIEDPVGCRRFTVMEIGKVNVGPSPFKVRQRLRKSGVRPISNVVDATNYVMLELGHPLHAFDADRVVDRKLVIARAWEGQTLETLDGVKRQLIPEDLIIYDGHGPTSMSGTMGGARSEVTEATTRVFMEAASWDPPTIMFMSRRHDLRSEASMRFERGVDFNLAGVANQRASALVAEWAGGEAREGLLDVVGNTVQPAEVSLRLADVDRLLGPGFTTEEVTSILRRLGMGVHGTDPMRVIVPTFRPDVTRPADLVEEIARIHGFDRFAPTLPTGPAGGLTAEQRRQRKLLDVLAGAGINQAINLPFVGQKHLRDLGMSVGDDDLLKVKNPLREEEGRLRPSLLPGLLDTLRYNLSHGAGDVSFFEVGSVFWARPAPWEKRLPDQYQRLAWAMIGDVGLRRLEGTQLTADSGVSLGMWRMLQSALGIEATVENASPPGFHPTRTAAISVAGAVIGHVGELSPRSARLYGLPGRVAIAELDLDPLIAPALPIAGESPSTYPHVDFDLSFLVDSDLASATLLAATVGVAEDLVESARVFDEFRGVGPDKKALAIRYRLRAADRTLASDEIASVRSEMIAAGGTLGAELRGA